MSSFFQNFRNAFILLGLALVVALPCPAAEQEASEQIFALPTNPPAWARDDDGFSVVMESDPALDGREVARVRHGAPTDWAIRIPGRIPAKRGDVFQLTWTIKNVEEAACSTGVILYDQDGNALDWNYGGAEIHRSDDWTRGESRFVVPSATVEIEARVIGSGKTDVSVASLTIQKVDELELVQDAAPFQLENAFLRVDVAPSTGLFSVLDKRTERVWSQSDFAAAQFVKKAEKRERSVELELLDGRTFVSYVATLELVPDAPELLVRLSAPGDLSQRFAISYPAPFVAAPTDRLVLPVNEGISFPATEPTTSLGTIHTFGGHGLCMAFWGFVKDVVDAKASDGMLGIIETPDDSEIGLLRRPIEGNDSATVVAVAQRWHGSMRKFGYDKTLRLAFFDQGGYVALCKRYRQFALESGRLATFKDKEARYPALKDGYAKLLGAANIWSWNGDRLETIAILRELGIDRILWSGGGSAEDLDAMNAMPNVLTSRYDIYQDVMNPERYDEINGVHGDWIPEAWPKDLNWDSPDGKWTRGWEIDPKEKGKPRIPCGVVCDLRTLDYAKVRIAKELETKNYKCRFLDTTVASPWRECWNPDHPATRTQSKEARMKLLDLVHQFGLVCGSETGIDASVPFCDFYEGMMSLGPYRCHDSGRYLDRIWYDVPELVGKYQLGETYRLPLFELVYHDCVVSYWYWGDHNNKFPALWNKRDLFNSLYAVPPMYCFTRQFLDENRERFAQSYQVAAKSALLADFSEMTNHEILTPDRKVQKSTFANGLEIVANFSDQEFQYAVDGKAPVVVPPRSSAVVATPNAETKDSDAP